MLERYCSCGGELFVECGVCGYVVVCVWCHRVYTGRDYLAYCVGGAAIGQIEQCCQRRHSGSSRAQGLSIDPDIEVENWRRIHRKLVKLLER